MGISVGRKRRKSPKGYSEVDRRVRGRNRKTGTIGRRETMNGKWQSVH